MNEWNDNQWREFFGDHSLELRISGSRVGC